MSTNLLSLLSETKNVPLKARLIKHLIFYKFFAQFLHVFYLFYDFVFCSNLDLYVRPTYSNVTELRSTILKKKEKLKKNQSQLEATNKYDDLEKQILTKLDEKNVLEKENREMAVLAEDERLKEKLLKFAADIDSEEEKDLKDDWNGFARESIQHDVDDVDVNGVTDDEVKDDDVAVDVENVTVNETGKNDEIR